MASKSPRRWSSQMTAAIKYGYHEYLLAWVLKNHPLHPPDKTDSFFHRAINYSAPFLSGVFAEVFYKSGISCSLIVTETSPSFSCLEGQKLKVRVTAKLAAVVIRLHSLLGLKPFCICSRHCVIMIFISGFWWISYQKVITWWKLYNWYDLE